MYRNTSDGSSDNEAVKIANAFKPFWKKWMKEWGRNCVRSKKMTVTTAPSILTGLIGVTDAFSDTECMIPFQMNVANAQVGDTVWVKWMYDNQQTMYAENMGNIRSEKVILSGVKNAEPVPSGGSVSYNISFEKPFKETPVVVASMISPHSVETGLCSVRIWDVSPFAFTVGYQNGSQYSRNIGASWIATGELLNNPIQYTTDTTPYLNRAIPYSSNYLNLNKVIGGTVCWNQLIPDAKITFTSTSTDTRSYINLYFRLQNSPYTMFLDKKISAVGLYSYVVKATESGIAAILHNGATRNQFYATNITVVNSHAYLLNMNFTGVDLSTVGGVTIKDFNLFDLTAMFGSAIADYIYALEQANAGAGVSWFKALFGDEYHAYAAGTLLSVKASAHVMKDANNTVIGNYPIDNVDLRGLPKLDANNKLYYDGDEYDSDGTVTRNYGIRAYQSGDESLTDAITDGTNTVYKLSTPTTETATAYTKAQTCDPNGTEEFIDGRTVEMPVGNETQYIVM